MTTIAATDQDRQTTPATRREVWLSIALAVARDGLPEPIGLNAYSDNRIVTLDFATHADARAWVRHLQFEAERINDDGSLWTFGHRDGWSWHLRCHKPDESVVPPSPLADQVAAAILTPDAWQPKPEPAEAVAE